MITDTIRTIAPHLQDHAIAKFPNERNHDVCPEFLSISDAEVRELGINPAMFEELPETLYDAPETVTTYHDDHADVHELYHVFLRSGVDRLLGPGWQTGRGR